MEYFYNTLGVLGAISLIVIIHAFLKLLLKACEMGIDYLNKESLEARKWVSNFKDIRWCLIGTSQPPNDKMITLHFRSHGGDMEGEYLETKISIDKGKY